LKVLVTGHYGFIGSAIASSFAIAGHEVTGIDVREPGGVDARDFFRQDDSRYDLVVHCAAVVGGRRVVIGSPLDHAQNLETDAALFAWARRTQPGRVIYFSSSCAYPVRLGRSGHDLREHDITWPPQPGMMPDELYGWTKLTGEFLANTARDDGLSVSIVRPFSVYGPGMAEGFAVRGFARQAQQRADPFEIWGDASQVRDFIHVSDVCGAVMAMAGQGIDGPVNLGTGIGTSLRDLAVMITAAFGYQPQVKVNTGLPAGVPRLVADTTRLRGFYASRIRLGDYITAGVSNL
jgi:nucleoside-diphosphate-sugar epimerase